MNKAGANPSPRSQARLAGVFYLLTILTTILPLAFPAARVPSNFIAYTSFLVVTLLLYDVFKPVNRGVSLLATLFGLLGCATGILGLFHLAPLPFKGVVFFGAYFLLLGYMILRSSIMPRMLGAILAVGGAAWLTFLSPPLAQHLAPYNRIIGSLPELLLTVWLLLRGVDESKWQQKAGSARAGAA